MDHLFYLLVRIFTALNQLQVVEDLLLNGNQYTGNHLLPDNRCTLEAVGYDIVNVLYEDHISIHIVQVFDQGTVSTRTEQQVTVLIAERGVVHGSSHRVSAGFLHAERNVILH